MHARLGCLKLPTARRQSMQVSLSGSPSDFSTAADKGEGEVRSIEGGRLPSLGHDNRLKQALDLQIVLRYARPAVPDFRLLLSDPVVKLGDLLIKRL